MDQITIGEIFRTVAVANFLFLCAVYFLWRISRNKDDLKAYVFFLGTLGAMAIFSLAA